MGTFSCIKFMAEAVCSSQMMIPSNVSGYFLSCNTFISLHRNGKLLSFFNSGASLGCLSFLPHSEFKASMIGHFKQTVCCKIFHIITLLNQSYLNCSSSSLH